MKNNHSLTDFLMSSSNITSPCTYLQRQPLGKSCPEVVYTSCGDEREMIESLKEKLFRSDDQKLVHGENNLIQESTSLSMYRFSFTFHVGSRDNVRITMERWASYPTKKLFVLDTVKTDDSKIIIRHSDQFLSTNDKPLAAIIDFLFWCASEFNLTGLFGFTWFSIQKGIITNDMIDGGGYILDLYEQVVKERFRISEWVATGISKT